MEQIQKRHPGGSDVPCEEWPGEAWRDDGDGDPAQDAVVEGPPLLRRLRCPPGKDLIWWASAPGRRGWPLSRRKEPLATSFVPWCTSYFLPPHFPRSDSSPGHVGIPAPGSARPSAAHLRPTRHGPIHPRSEQG